MASEQVIMMMWGYTGGWGWGPWLGMGFGMIVFWTLIIAGGIALGRYLGGACDRRESDTSGEQSSDTSGGQSNAEQILADRFACGEINEDEYRQRRELLRARR